MHIPSKSLLHSVGSFALMLMIICSAASSQGDIPTLFGEIHGNEEAVNSAVNVVAFSLGYFRKPVKMNAIALHLGTGVTWNQSTNLVKIGWILTNAGLRVSAKTGLTIATIAARLSKKPRPELAIIYLKNLHFIGGHHLHYVILLRSGKNHLFLADPGIYTESLDTQYLRMRLDHELGHSCLFVEPGGAPLAKRIYILADSRYIVLNIGEIAAGPGMLKISFLVRNTLKHPIGIGFVKGTCFCFRGATIDTPDQKIAPGQNGKITLNFKRDVIGTGNIEREVLLSFAGYPEHVLRVVIQAHITTAYPPAQLTWYPQAIELGQVRNRSILGGQEFTVLTPKGIFLKTPEASSKDIRVIRLNDSAGQSQVDDFGRTAHEFVVDLSNIPAGAVDQKITIGTTDKYIPKIVIPITGQIQIMIPMVKKLMP